MSSVETDVAAKTVVVQADASVTSEFLLEKLTKVGFGVGILKNVSSSVIVEEILGTAWEFVPMKLYFSKHFTFFIFLAPCALDTYFWFTKYYQWGAASGKSVELA